VEGPPSCGGGGVTGGDPDKEAAELVVVELQHVAQLDPEHTSLLIGVAHVSVIGGSVCLARGRIGC
jgi:hypothetical protein